MVNIGSVVWPGPVGIGAGIIKSSAAFLDYSQQADSLEIGSITQKMCHGNEGQIIWRDTASQSLRHNAGIPNPGADEIVRQLFEAQAEVKIPWGLNLAVTPGISDINEAAEDLRVSIRMVLLGGLRPHWITFNASSPDTVDDPQVLMEVQRVAACLTVLKMEANNYNLPIWLKLGPLTDMGELSRLLVMVIDQGVGALVVSNAMKDNSGLSGGWCGGRLRPVSLDMIKQIRQINKDLPIVAVGGIFTGAQVKETIEAGAQAVQVVSAVLYQGHAAASKIRKEWESLR